MIKEIKTKKEFIIVTIWFIMTLLVLKSCFAEEPSIWLGNGTAPDNAILKQDFIYVDWDYNLSEEYTFEAVGIAVFKNILMGEESEPDFGFREANPDVKNHTFFDLDYQSYYYLVVLDYSNIVENVTYEYEIISEMRFITLESGNEFEINFDNTANVIFLFVMVFAFLGVMTLGFMFKNFGFASLGFFIGIVIGFMLSSFSMFLMFVFLLLDIVIFYSFSKSKKR